MMTSERISLPAAALPADNNIRHQYPIHRGTWVRHPETTTAEPSFCRYSLDFKLAAADTIELHISADHRFELWCDDVYIGMGPDRSDLDHWSFHIYRLQLDAGDHRLTADVHFLGLNPALRPMAQTCIEPGFVLYAENAAIDLNTGSAPWKVVRLEGVATSQIDLKTFFVVGPNYTIDAARFFNPPPAVDPVVVREAGRNIQSGTMLPGWKLYPTRMPEQTREPVAGGRIRFVGHADDDKPFPAETEGNSPDAIAGWQALIDSGTPITVPPRTRLTVLWDLDEYRTAYPELTTSGGAGSSVKIDWAESFYINHIDVEGHAARRGKGNRNEFVGKYFRGNGDTFLPDGPVRTFRTYWWRAGRYVRLVIETRSEPLTLHRLCLLESRMPLENQSNFTSSDASLQTIIPIAVRGIQMCAHETYMDCPYYEQMMYVGDTRLQMLTAYTMSAEDRLNQRALELFDWSRQETGFVLERCPSQPKQLSCTFSMIWVLMLRDYAWWRNNPAFMRDRIKGMRCMLEEFKALPDTHAPLLPALPGWSFMDWVEGMSFVNNPGPEASVSAVVNLLFLHMLDAAADLEASLGEPHLADYNRRWAARVAQAVDRLFWDEQRSLFADDREHSQFSEHSQSLALLSGRFPARDARCFESLVTAPDLVRTTVYFSHYLLETFARFGRGDLILNKLDFWREMAGMGLKTPIESPEPTRSDCHAWSSHPLFHLHASVAGIRPAAPGFASVSIAPSPGTLTELSSTIPHPSGTVSLTMYRSDVQWHVVATLPHGVEGTLHWQGHMYPITGTTRLTLPVRA
jgi:alpha-L-rhamnosidase